MSDTKPETKFRIGALSATVWKNETDGGRSFYSVDISRGYKDDDDEWKQTSRFSAGDLLNVAKLADRAEAWIAEQDEDAH